MFRKRRLDAAKHHQRLDFQSKKRLPAVDIKNENRDLPDGNVGVVGPRPNRLIMRTHMWEQDYIPDRR